ncbi:taste receptor type 2 member 41 [Hippopotamus amphibius kiboko]|uniref:taste receptor type 2 member 41 n=1 Tax=Hippopotamus amphibius kiboko TaxID=575201 RepID=UPI002591CD6C|nr:taste receptor type 2 member 41 [Hippopotamus amphibius kiboko]
MQPAFTVLFMMLFVLFCVLGLLANGFIVLVLSREWVRRGRLLPSDMILFSLGVSRFCLQWVGMANNFYYFHHLAEYCTSPTRQFFGLPWDFLNSVTFWFGSWLSVLFCMKIANLSHPTFLWLKWRFPGSVPWLLLGSLFTSLIVTLLYFWGNHALYKGFFIRKFSGNMTYNQWNRRLEIYYFLPLKLVTLSIPCSVFLVSMALLIDSLRRHTWRMRHNAHSLQDPSAQAHTRALKSLVSFLVLYALSFMSLIIDAAGFFSENDWYWPWQILTYLCTSIHPFILILSNLRLRGVFGQLILLVRGFLVA